MKVIVISGPAGSGKSMALDAILASLKEMEVPVVCATGISPAHRILQCLETLNAKHLFIDDCPDSLLEQLQGACPDVTAYVVQGSTFIDPMGDVAVAGEILQDACHRASKSAGWWVNPKTGEPTQANPMCFSQKLCLIHSEISEAMEADRKGLMDDKLPHRTGREVELADAVIRIFDLAGAYGMDLGGAIAEKMACNAQRADHKPEARQAAGGKAY